MRREVNDCFCSGLGNNFLRVREILFDVLYDVFDLHVK